ncbi:MAG: hypothetical protein U1F70_02090 [Candidatus Competibacteraceae bacterium]
MPTLNGEYPDPNAYWDLVQDTLKDVFNTQPDRLKELLEEFWKLRNRVDKSELEERNIFYHAEPLDVAADLAEQLPTPEQVERYLTIARKPKTFSA